MIRDLHKSVTLIEQNWLDTHVLIIGDLMLDRYIWGEVERISPEAPVPVVRATQNSERAGGAANVAMNIAGLGARATVLGFCGLDKEREILQCALESARVASDLTPVPSHPTTVKLRILGGQQQMLRLDVERTDGYPDEAYEDLAHKIEKYVPQAGAVVLSDYGKGTLREDICQLAIRLAHQHGIPVLVDPKQRDFSRYRGATTICPNAMELSIATAVAPHKIDDLLSAGQQLGAELDLKYMIATLSDKGIALLSRESKVVAPAMARQVFDVSGAGDTVIATLSLAIAAGLDPHAAIQLANVAAGIVVGKVGTVPISREELLVSLTPEIELHAEEKVLHLESLKARLEAWRAAGNRVVFTNGCFDLLHIGHIRLLQEARAEGDRLVVAINSDASVSALKGPTRPIVGEVERAHVLAALSAVDAVTVFDTPTPLELILALRPDVIVKGGDYDESTVVGAKEVRSWNGRVKIVPTIEGFSTTKLIAKAIAT